MSFVLEDDPQWYKDAIIYELHVRAFHDSNADGIGDFEGLTQKLDYLQDLGITAIWLLPFYPSPLKDDGYDIADYTDVHPSYGTLADFKTFLRAAHQRGIRVITELVVNHTSDQHAWFQRARRARPGSTWRDFYVWNDSVDKYRDARIIFKDFETSNWAWDPVANAYYWHRFYHHQPDLNFDNPEVAKQILQVMHFWLNLGVDGMRLDAVPYLYEREGTNCENLPDTHQVLRLLRREIDGQFRNRMLLAEANQWPEDAVAYFGKGDECHMAFHFPVMPRMFMALRMEDRFPIIDILSQTPQIPESCQWALFLRNHDELTLEMVTDEERDYMYRAYAHDPQMRVNLGIRRRLASLLGKDWNRIELMNALLFSLPGTPVLYYGDEIAMGDNIYLGDRNAVRTPMQWSADRNAGFSRASPHRLYLPIVIDPDSHYEAFNVEAQQNNPHSMLWWTKRLIALRKRFKAFGRGSLEFIYPENHRVLAFLRKYQNEVILVVANLSRFPQHAELDLSEFKGSVPTELFGRTEFPVIGSSAYMLTLGPHSFYWFSLTPQRVGVSTGHSNRAEELVSVETRGSWTSVFTGPTRAVLEGALPAYLMGSRWFYERDHVIKTASFVDIVPISPEQSDACFTQVAVEYTEEDPETYAVPLAWATGHRADQLLKSNPEAILARVQCQNSESPQTGVIYDAVLDKNFCMSMLGAIVKKRSLKGVSGEILAAPFRRLKDDPNARVTNLDASSLLAEESNSSVVFGDRFILKLYRKMEFGMNPELELGRFLSEQSTFTHTPRLAGSAEYRRNGETAAVGILHRFVANEGDAWRQTLDALSQYFDRALTAQMDIKKLLPPARPLVELIAEPLVSNGQLELVGPYYESVKLLGQRTAELHVALASSTEPEFVPEPFTLLYQRSLYQSMRNHAGQIFLRLRKRLNTLPGGLADDVLSVLDAQHVLIDRFRGVLSARISAQRTRIVGDFHLGQVLYTGKDYYIIDLEGERSRPLSERRLKRTPLRDVASMLRSFQYAAYTSLFGHLGSATVRPEDLATLEPWARVWTVWVSSAFLNSYIEHAERGGFLPPDPAHIRLLLETYLLERALYELGYELHYRPEWIRIPLIGIQQILQSQKAAA